MRNFCLVFLTIFLAELGDKTQLATFTFSIDRQVSRWGIFVASSLALVFSSLIAVLLGSQLGCLINPKTLRIIAGLGFVGIGILTLFGIKA